jgi:anaerobic selenocysteine-containing dehydrogenase
MTDRKRIRQYNQPAGGWGALKALGEHLVEQGIPIKGAMTLGRMNQPQGFDCPGCAWPDPKHTSSFEYCENGGKIFEGYNARIRVPGGFHLTSSARERIWNTVSGKANFLVYDGLGEDPATHDPDVLWLTSVRSHDQYNTTLYSLSDRYRGVYGQRDVVFLGEEEIARRGFKAGDRVDLVAVSSDGVERRVRDYQLVAHAFPAGSCAAYYPETNPLVALDAHDPMSFTPSYKGIAVRLVAAHGGGRRA